MTAPGATPARWILLLHGILGRGRNWASIAAALCAARPDVGVMLVDLRLHGGSQGFPPPHDLAHAAADVESLLRDPARRVVGVAGHSFGGKVALALASRGAALERVWVLDASPSIDSPEGNTWKVLRLMRALPARFAARDDAIRGLLAGGIDEPTARWIATNLVPAPATAGEPAGYRWLFDLDGIEALMRDYFAVDLWPAIESRPKDGAEIVVVKATRSVAITAEDEARLVRAAARNPGVRLVRVDAGHWLHVENPAEVLRVLAAES